MATTEFDRLFAAMPPEAQAEYTRIFGTDEEAYGHFLARGAEPFGLNVYSPEQWRRRRRLDVMRIVYADGGATTIMSRRRSRPGNHSLNRLPAPTSHRSRLKGSSASAN